jgi:hypothetical protein
LIITLFFSLPLINSHLLDFFNLESFWKYFYINWNYEFSKVIFFNIISSIIIIIFFIKNFRLNKTYIPKIVYLIILLLVISNIFSFSEYTSLLWNNEKWHWTLMFLNLIWIFIILLNSFKKHKDFKKNIFKSIITSSFIVSIIWTKELLLPSFNYWDLNNRALSTFWHPNYLALYLLIIIPITNSFLNKTKIKAVKYFYGLVLFFLILTLLLTKSVWAIFLFFSYLFYLKYSKIKLSLCWTFSLKLKRKKLQNVIIIFFYLFFVVIWVISILRYYPEKLSSFISRFYIWEATSNIIFSDFKIPIFWNWLWNLSLVFEWYKNTELYIFENYWFIADRPHNIFIYILYSFWIIWLWLFWCTIKLLFTKIKTKRTKKDLVLFHIIILFLLFNLLNFSSIASYLIIIFIISLISYPYIKFFPLSLVERGYKLIISILFITTSLFSIYFYSIYFLKEHRFYNNPQYKTNNYFLNKIESEDKEKYIFKNYYEDYEKLCLKLIKNSSSVESYFYCWDLLYLQNKNLSINYYNLWLNKLPDLWNNESQYFDNILINKNNLKHRFFSEKYSNINQILERVWIKNIY